MFPGVAKRSYGTERLYVVVDRGRRGRWYRSWWIAGTRVKRKVGVKRTPGNADGLTRTQAERELRLSFVGVLEQARRSPGKGAT